MQYCEVGHVGKGKVGGGVGALQEDGAACSSLDRGGGRGEERVINHAVRPFNHPASQPAKPAQPTNQATNQAVVLTVAREGDRSEDGRMDGQVNGVKAG